MRDLTGPGGAPVSVGFTLSQLGLATSRGFASLVGSIGLEPRQFAVLRAAEEFAGESQQAIADRLAIPASTMVGIVDGLEHAGFVTRERRTSDRRAHTLVVTEEGRARLARGLEIGMAREGQLCEGLTDAERSTLLSLLGRVAANLGIKPGALPDAGSGLEST